MAIVVMLETVPGLSHEYSRLFHAVDMASVTIFSVEYILRIWSCTVYWHWRRPILGRLRFMVTPMAVIDLAAILPFYLPLVVPLDLRMLRAVRLFRLFRILKMSRYSASLQTLGRVLNQKKEDLAVIVVLLVFASSLMYVVENHAQPQVFSSTPASMWWGVGTLTTVSGDIQPLTLLGKILASIIAVLGIVSDLPHRKGCRLAKPLISPP